VKNQVYTGTPTSRRFATCPTTILAGQPVLLGSEPAIALDNYQANTGGTTFLTGGSFVLTTVGKTSLSPSTPAALKAGAKVYADTDGTTDSVTNVTYGFTLDGNSSGTLFGYVDPSYIGGVTSGATDTAAVIRLQGAE
jgi:predicted RecA/RadA family phage recombinase